MREFFRGWRRKIGVVMLGLACVFAAAWVRSIFRYTRIEFPVGSSTTASILSTGQFIGCGLEFDAYGSHWMFHDFSVQQAWPGHPEDGLNPLCHSRNLDWVSLWFGFGLGGVNDPPEFWRLKCSLPCWSIVLPLTVLSAWLLITKPRATTPTGQQPNCTTLNAEIAIETERTR